MRILIIDDGPSGDDLSHHLRTMYGAEPFRAKTMSDGMRMRTEITSLDFIVLDLSLPDMKTRADTVACIPRLKETAPVFVYTGYEEADLLEKAYGEGAIDCFLKGDARKGAAALSSRLASLALRNKRTNGSTGHIVRSIVQDRTSMVVPEAPPHGWLKRHEKQILVAIAILSFAIPQVKGWITGYATDQTQSFTIARDVKSILETLGTMSKRQNEFDGRLNATDTRVQRVEDDSGNMHKLLDGYKADTDKRLDKIDAKLDQLLGLKR